jgi:hypothetical protein
MDCQDYHATCVVETQDGPVVILALADGAGSAAASLHGARTAVTSAMRSMCAAVRRDGRAALVLGTIGQAIADARAGVFQTVDEFGHLPSEYASTLLLAAASPERTVVAHVGDGAIVVEDDALRVLSYPEQGEYANATRFLIDDDALDAARLVEHGGARRIALLSDGLQALALEYDSRSAHAPFFEPIFAHVEATREPPEALALQLAAWLGSGAVNARTDDDKSLVIAVRAE